MSIGLWIIFGLIAGAIAKFLMPGRAPSGWIITIALGIVGALVGGLIATQLLNWGDISGFNFRSMLIAVGGAVVVLFIYGLVMQKR
jgi:uncharacterized membrane protein YeaQ/YmgE (transglycosylase-associated protein family)